MKNDHQAISFNCCTDKHWSILAGSQRTLILFIHLPSLSFFLIHCFHPHPPLGLHSQGVCCGVRQLQCSSTFIAHSLVHVNSACPAATHNLSLCCLFICGFFSRTHPTLRWAAGVWWRCRDPFSFLSLSFLFIYFYLCVCERERARESTHFFWPFSFAFFSSSSLCHLIFFLSSTQPSFLLFHACWPGFFYWVRTVGSPSLSFSYIFETHAWKLCCVFLIKLITLRVDLL